MGETTLKRPAFQFYPSDWASNSNLRRCSWAARGAWIEVMGLMHDSDRYGTLAWPLKEIAQALGCPLALLKELVAKGVMKGADSGVIDAHIFVPRSGRKDGAPVTLVPESKGPLWFSSRMVKDEYIRRTAGASTRFGASNDAQNDRQTQAQEREQPRSAGLQTERAKLRSKVLAKTGGHCHHCGVTLSGARWEIDHYVPRAKGGRHTFDNLVPSCVPCNQDKSDTLPDDWCSPSRREGARQGESPSRRSSDGPSSSSSSSEEREEGSVASATGSAAAPPPSAPPPIIDPEKVMFDGGIALLGAAGTPERQARSLLGKWRRDWGTEAVIVAIGTAKREGAIAPIEFITKALETRNGKRGMEGHNGANGAGPYRRSVGRELLADAERQWLAEQGANGSA